MTSCGSGWTIVNKRHSSKKHRAPLHTLQSQSHTLQSQSQPYTSQPYFSNLFRQNSEQYNSENKYLQPESLQALIRMRIAMTLNQQKADELCGFQSNTFKDIECNRCLPTEKQRLIIQSVLGVNLIYWYIEPQYNAVWHLKYLHEKYASMIQPIRCIPSLIYHLSTSPIHAPFSILHRYQGNDWTSLASNYPMSLFRNQYMELMICNWAKGKSDLYYNNYSTVLTRVLQGSFHAVEIKSQVDGTTLPKKYMTLLSGESYTFYPFSKVTMVAQEPSTTLQLYYYQNMWVSDAVTWPHIRRV